MDRPSNVVKTVIVVVAAALVSMPLAMISWVVMIKWGVRVSVGFWVMDLLPSKGGMSEGLERMGVAFWFDVCFYFVAICLLALVAERRHQRRPSA